MILHLFKLYIIYFKYNPKTGEIYVGMSSRMVSEANNENAEKIKNHRDSGHHKNKDGFENAELELYHTDGDAIRGREELLIQFFKNKGISGNKNNGISVRNKKRKQYLEAALRVFGDAVITSIAVLVWNNLF